MSFLSKLTPADLDAIHRTLVYKRNVVSPDSFEALSTLSERECTLMFELLGTAGSVLGTRATLGIDDYNPLLNGTAPENIEKRQFPRFFHPVYTAQRVSIPTVHVRGRHDAPAIQRLGLVAQGLCDKGEMTVIEHDGIHEIPRKPNEVREVVGAIEKASYRGQRNPYGGSAML